MNLAMALLLGTAIPSAVPDNFDFRTGTLSNWEGSGFYLTTGTGNGPSLHFGVSSSDQGTSGNTGMILLTFEVPENAGIIRFKAHAVRGKDQDPDENLDVLLLAPGRRVIPKQIRVKDGWKPAPRLLPSQKGRPREYFWQVAPYAGQTLRIVLVDEDKRPGCHVFCSGFEIIPAYEFDAQEFGQYMLKVVQEHRLPPLARFESKHFLALSNADDKFTELRLNNCELLYDLFFDYFRGKGFPLREPSGKLMVAIFDSQYGFESFLGRRMSPSITGIYHTVTNRLVVYDYGTNNAFVNQKRQQEAKAKRIGSDLARHRQIETVNRQAQEFRTEANIGTVMHEAAHQLSFNSGMLNRDGDVPFWLAEGLACFCEATQHGSWQGIGEMNPERLNPLVSLVRGQGRFMPLYDLITRDDWPRGRGPSEFQCYAQSWALFHMLMNERPEQLRYYLSSIYLRRTSAHRLADFTQAFGTDLKRLDLRYTEYVKDLVEHYRPAR